MANSTHSLSSVTSATLFQLALYSPLHFKPHIDIVQTALTKKKELPLTCQFGHSVVALQMADLNSNPHSCYPRCLYAKYSRDLVELANASRAAAEHIDVMLTALMDHWKVNV